MSTHCDDLSNLIFDVREKLSDEEYIEMYRLLEQVSKSVRPPNSEALDEPSHEEMWNGESTITLPVSMYKAEISRAESTATREARSAVQVCAIILGFALILR